MASLFILFVVLCLHFVFVVECCGVSNVFLFCCVCVLWRGVVCVFVECVRCVFSLVCVCVVFLCFSASFLVLVLVVLARFLLFFVVWVPAAAFVLCTGVACVCLIVSLLVLFAFFLSCSALCVLRGFLCDCDLGWAYSFHF